MRHHTPPSSDRTWIRGLLTLGGALPVLLAAVLMSFGGLAVSPQGVMAQPGPECFDTLPNQNPDECPPFVDVSPSSGTYTGSVSVTIDWCDDQFLSTSTREIDLIVGSDTTNLNASFTYQTVTATGDCSVAKESTATIDLEVGSGSPPHTNTLRARICDASSGGNCTTTTAILNYDAGVTVTDGSSKSREADGSTYTDEFTVTNTGGATKTFNFTVDLCESPPLDLNSCSVSPTSASLAADADTTVEISYDVEDEGTGQAKMKATQSDNSDVYDTDYFTITGTDSRAAPIIDMAFHNDDYVDMSKCTVDCFDATVSYTTPAYFSMNQPRAVTLVYRSNQADPQVAFVADLRQPSGSTTPDHWSLLVKNELSQLVTLSTGTTEVFFHDYTSSRRAAVQFDASNLATGVYEYTLVARSHYQSGGDKESTKTVRFMVVNEKDSEFGHGWSVAGLQTLYKVSSTKIAITEGDGSIAYFHKSGGDWVSPDGDFTHLASGGSPTKWTRTYPDGTEVVFPDPSTGSSERMESVEDRFGNETTYTYDVNDHLDKITDPAGKEIDFTYTDSTKVEIKDPGSPTRITTLTIDNDGNLTTIKDPALKNVLVATYDSDHRIKRRTDRRGGVWGFAYDDFGKLAADTMPQVYADGSNRKPIVEFHSLEAELLEGSSGAGTEASPFIPMVATSVQVEVEDPDGNDTRYTLHRLGPTTKIDHPLNVDTNFAVDSKGRATTINPPGNGSRTITWDPAQNSSRMSSTRDMGSRDTYYRYAASAAFPDTLFALPDSIYGDVPARRLYWSAKGELDSVKVATSSVKTKYTYDTRGRVLTMTDPEAHVTTYFYPDTTSAGFWNVDSVTVENRTTKFGYDAYGREKSVTAPNGDVTTVDYDLINRVDKVTAADGGVTDFTYDDLYLTQIKDAINQTYDYTVNALGWVTEREDPRGESDAYAYDILGRVSTWTDRLGRDTDYEYDALGNLELMVADGDSVTYNIATDGDYYVVDNGFSRDSSDTTA